MAETRASKASYPRWVCAGCAEAAGGRIPPGHLSTWHEGTCEVCTSTRPVTEPRDYGYPDFSRLTAEKRWGKDRVRH